MRQPLRNNLGLADLVKVLHSDSGLERREIFSLFGYQEKKKKTPEKNNPDFMDNPGLESTYKTKSRKLVNAVGGFRPKYWQVLSLVEKKQNEKSGKSKKDESIASNIELSPGESPSGQTPRLPRQALLTDKEIWAHASCAANCSVSQSQIQIKQWYQALSRAEIPRRHVPEVDLEESGEIWLIADFDPRLMIWWDELNRVSAFLSRQFGLSRARIVPLINGDLSELYQNSRLPWPDKNTRILVFSDLGIYAEQATRSKWKNVLQRWQAVGAHVAAFVPHSVAARELAKASTNRTIRWDESSHKSGKKDVVNNLLACLSIVQWCSPALLRVWRRLLQGNIEDEWRLSQHAKVWMQPGACGLLDGDREKYRRKFSQFSNDLKELIQSASGKFRVKVSNAVKFEESYIQKSLGLKVSSEYFSTAQSYTVKFQSRQHLSFAENKWLWDLSERQDKNFWKNNPEIEKICFQSREKLAKNSSIVPLAPGMDIENTIPDDTRKELGVKITGTSMEISDDLDSIVTGLDLVSIKTSKNGVRCKTETGHRALMRNFFWKPGKPIKLSPKQHHKILLNSDLQTLELEQVEKPGWAKSMEQGPDGLYCTLPNGRRLRWCYPGEPNNGLMHPLDAPKKMVKATWVDEKQWQAFQSDQLPYLPVSATLGTDQYGNYAEISVSRSSRVNQENFRFRWIAPGEFWMGSAQDEPGHRNNETRHGVLLTQGYWLAETACSQALWYAVMGKNPGHFEDERLPVEQTSWEDVQIFCEKLKQQLPELKVRLPSEAEWEYACRAGTKTPFWWGDELNAELANYDGNRSYNNGPNGEWRRKTLPVKSFEANPWGLYQTHGNVWEWCEDNYGEYKDSELQIDPAGPDDGSFRVARGGSWYDDGGWLCAAFRDYFSPDVRLNLLGFRLAAGPHPGGAKE